MDETSSRGSNYDSQQQQQQQQHSYFYNDGIAPNESIMNVNIYEQQLIDSNALASVASDTQKELTNMKGKLYKIPSIWEKKLEADRQERFIASISSSSNNNSSSSSNNSSSSYGPLQKTEKSPVQANFLLLDDFSSNPAESHSGQREVESKVKPKRPPPAVPR